MERNPETTRLMLLGLQRLATTVLRDATRGTGELELLPLGELFVSSEANPHPAYAGIPVAELVAESNFPEVAWLLAHGDLPNVEFLADFQTLLVHETFELPESVGRVVAELPMHVGDDDVLRIGFNVLAAFDPQIDDVELHSDFGKTTRLLAAAPDLIAVRSGAENWDGDDASYAARVAHALAGHEVSHHVERAVDAMLVVLAEQSRDPSTLAARVVASNGGDVFAAVSAALAALDVRIAERHCTRIDALLDEMERVDDLEAWLEHHLSSASRLPGFSVDSGPDARALALDPLCAELAAESEREQTERGARLLERLAVEQIDAHPTLLWPLARLLRYTGLGPMALGPLLMIARIAGWSAHAQEEVRVGRRLAAVWDESDERRAYVPLDDRG